MSTNDEGTTMRSAAKAKIAQYLARFFPVYELRDDDDIFELGFVSSMFAMQLIAFIEHEFDITVENEDLELAHFRSIGALHAFVTRKLSAAVTP